MYLTTGSKQWDFRKHQSRSPRHKTHYPVQVEMAAEQKMLMKERKHITLAFIHLIQQWCQTVLHYGATSFKGIINNE